MSSLPEKIISLISRTPIPLTNEKAVQASLSELFKEHNIIHKREVVLSAGNVVDFSFQDGLFMEVKIKASKRAIYRQCKRYCEHEQVAGLILASATAMGFPDEVHGKPCWVASLGVGWL